MRTRKRQVPGDGGVHLCDENGHLIVRCRDVAEADLAAQAVSWAVAEMKEKVLRSQRETELVSQSLVESL